GAVRSGRWRRAGQVRGAHTQHGSADRGPRCLAACGNLKTGSPPTMKKSVPVEELQFGMYVAELDRPWTDTPFMFQGFVLQRPEQLDTLKKYCRTVVVDSEKSQLPDASPPPRASAPARRQVQQAPAERH